MGELLLYTRYLEKMTPITVPCMSTVGQLIEEIERSLNIKGVDLKLSKDELLADLGICNESTLDVTTKPVLLKSPDLNMTQSDKSIKLYPTRTIFEEFLVLNQSYQQSSDWESPRIIMGCNASNSCSQIMLGFCKYSWGIEMGGNLSLNNDYLLGIGWTGKDWVFWSLSGINGVMEISESSPSRGFIPFVNSIIQLVIEKSIIKLKVDDCILTIPSQKNEEIMKFKGYGQNFFVGFHPKPNYMGFGRKTTVSIEL